MKPKKTDKNLIYFDKNSRKTLNKKKVIGLILLCILALSLLITYMVYAKNESFRKYLDENILRKNIEENSLQSIAIKDYDKSNIFAVSKNILILKNNTLEIYNTSGKKETEIRIEISNPIIDKNSGN